MTADEILASVQPHGDELPWLRITTGNVSRDAKIYSARDVEAFMSIAIAVDRAQRSKPIIEGASS